MSGHSQHFIWRCSCGVVIRQCRCPDLNKKEEVWVDGCPDCQAKVHSVRQGESPTGAPQP